VASSVQSNLKSSRSSLSKRVEENVNTIEGIGAIATGPVRVTDFSASSAVTPSTAVSQSAPAVAKTAQQSGGLKWLTDAKSGFRHVWRKLNESVREHLPRSLKPYSQGAIWFSISFLVLLLVCLFFGTVGHKGYSPASGSEEHDDYHHLALVNPDEADALGPWADTDPTTDPGSVQYRPPYPEDDLDDQERRGGARGLGMHQMEEETAEQSPREGRPGAAGPRNKNQAQARDVGAQSQAAPVLPAAAAPADAGDDGLEGFLQLATDMGFTREQALEALDQHDGNSEAALEGLLSPA